MRSIREMTIQFGSLTLLVGAVTTGGIACRGTEDVGLDAYLESPTKYAGEDVRLEGYLTFVEEKSSLHSDFQPTVGGGRVLITDVTVTRLFRLYHTPDLEGQYVNIEETCRYERGIIAKFTGLDFCLWEVDPTKIDGGRLTTVQLHVPESGDYSCSLWDSVSTSLYQMGSGSARDDREFSCATLIDVDL